jgi:hypothetical protein
MPETRRETGDLSTDETEIDRLLSRVRPIAPPLGFRDDVMRRVRERRAGWELLVAAALALPSLAFLAWILVEHGDEFVAGLDNVFAAAQGTGGELVFFVDGLVVLAVALLGIASVLVTHVLLGRDREAAR